MAGKKRRTRPEPHRELRVGSRTLKLRAQDLIGVGGEAEVFGIGGGQVLKLFKGPDHPEFAGDPRLQELARRRLIDKAEKLAEFPSVVPARVVPPRELAIRVVDDAVVGFTMESVEDAFSFHLYADHAFRNSERIVPSRVVPILKDLHATIRDLHGRGIVIGDLSDRNILVHDATAAARLIDADSLQFGRFLSDVYTEMTVDPRLCDPNAPRPIPLSPHDEDSDWYAFAVLLMRSLLLVGPYGGVHRPDRPSQRVPVARRALERVTVFSPDVRYPRPALPREVLPDELLQHLMRVFTEDVRGEFPVGLIQNLPWLTCPSCGLEHTRRACPRCRTILAGAPALAGTAPHGGAWRCDLMFETRGQLLEVAVVAGALRWLSHDDQRYLREDGREILRGAFRPGLHPILAENDTWLRSGTTWLRMGPSPGESGEQRRRVDPGPRDLGHPGGLAVTASGRAIWTADGRLWREGPWAPEVLGEVLAGQTRFWIGADLGFGLYRAGGVIGPFLFDPSRPGLNESVEWPRLGGTIVSAHALISRDAVALALEIRDGARRLWRWLLWNRRGELLALAEGEDGAESWLSGASGACLHGETLLVPTDDGVVRVDAVAGAWRAREPIAGTAPFVDGASRLFVDAIGLVVVNGGSIARLRPDGKEESSPSRKLAGTGPG